MRLRYNRRKNGSKCIELVRAAFICVTVVNALAMLGSCQEIVAGTNGKITFDRGGQHGTRDIWVMNADGSSQKQLTKNFGYNFGARWSPDGTKIAFTHGPSQTDRPDIYVMNADGTGITQLTNDPTNGSVKPTWSPDATKIAFARSKDNGSGFINDIYVMNANGSNVTLLTFGGGGNTSTSDNRSPAWSPDGTTIAFESTRTGVDHIWVMPASGSATPTDLTPSDSVQDRLPAWSPDGAKIVFDSFRGGTEQIVVMNADGTGQTVLTPATEFDVSSAWSPDGTEIAFSSNASGQYDIWLMNPSGSGRVHLSNSRRQDDFRPDWAIALPCNKPHCH